MSHRPLLSLSSLSFPSGGQRSSLEDIPRRLLKTAFGKPCLVAGASFFLAMPSAGIEHSCITGVQTPCQTTYKHYARTIACKFFFSRGLQDQVLDCLWHAVDSYKTSKNICHIDTIYRGAKWHSGSLKGLWGSIYWGLQRISEEKREGPSISPPPIPALDPIRDPDRRCEIVSKSQHLMTYQNLSSGQVVIKCYGG